MQLGSADGPSFAVGVAALELLGDEDEEDEDPQTPRDPRDPRAGAHGINGENAEGFGLLIKPWQHGEDRLGLICV